ncbi:MAG: hypothetical protein AAF333_08280 [Planctomycetota bacterium]
MIPLLRFPGTLLFVITTLSPVAAAALELPAVFSDGMVLQRGMPVPVWGKAEPGQRIQVALSAPPGGIVNGTADANGDWRVELPAMPASAEPIAMRVEVAEEVALDEIDTHEVKQVWVKDVLVGDVWHCSGQSNMSWSVLRSDNAEQEIAAADSPAIRLFRVPNTEADAPRFSSGGRWLPATPEHVGGFSAVAYYFGRRLHASQGVPIGLIVTSWGGASAEAYTSTESQASNPDTDNELLAYRAELARLRDRADNPVDVSRLPERHADPGPTPASAAYVEPGFDDSDWAAVELPNTFERTALGDIDGGVWFRKTVTLPEGWRGQALKLSLGPIDDFDRTFVNGTAVGAVGPETPQFWAYPRVYDVPAEAVNDETLTIAVRVFDHLGDGGFVGTGGQMSVTKAQGDAPVVSLAGPWRAWADQPMSPEGLRSAHRVRQPQHTPAALWHGMIHPVAPYAHRGVTWYQGESNAGRGVEYRVLLPLMIEDWRQLWNQPGEHRDTPFLIVQLANFEQPAEQPPVTDGWGELRDSQAAVAAHVSNAHIATAIDIGQADDIHPTNKQDVGLRLARLAERHVYEDASVVPVGPTMLAVSNTTEPSSSAIVFWEHAEVLKTNDGQPPRGFAMRPMDGEQPWVWAEAAISQDGLLKVVRLEHPEGLQGPFEVRYAYGINPTDGPQGINLVNGEGLPAMPFRTDVVPPPE